MRFAVSVVVLLQMALSASPSLADDVSQSHTEVVTLDQLVARTARFSQEYPDNPTALLELGRAYLFAYVNDQYYFPLDVDSGVLPTWRLQEDCLVPVYRNELLRRRPGDGMAHLVNAIQVLRNALTRDAGNDGCRVTLAFACLEAAEHGEALASLREDSSPDSDAVRPENQTYWRNLSLELCRATLAVSDSKGETSTSEIRDYANAMVWYLLHLRRNRTVAEVEEEQRAGDGIGSNEALMLFRELRGRETRSELPTEPLTSIEQLYPQVPSATNGALFYLDAADAYIEPRGKWSTIGELEAYEVPANHPTPIEPEDVAILGTFLDANSTCLELIRQGGSCGTFRYPIDAEDGVYASLWHTMEIRKLSRLLRVQALHASLTGDRNRALESIHALVTLSNSLRTEPFMISQLVRNGLCGVALKALEQVVNQIGLIDEQLLELQSAVKSLEDRRALRAALEGERWRLNLPITEADLELPAIAIGRVVEDGRTPEQLRAYRDKLEVDQKLALAQVDACLADMDAPWPQLYGLVCKQMEPVNRMNPAHGRSMLSFISNAARIRTAQAALAAKRYQLRNGDLPASLEMLVPDFLQEEGITDPFDGKSLRLEVAGERYLIYSVGDPTLNERAKRDDETAVSLVMFGVVK